MPFDICTIQNPEKIYWKQKRNNNTYYYQSSNEQKQYPLSKIDWIESSVGNSATGENLVNNQIRNSFKGNNKVEITFDYNERKNNIKLNKLFPEFQFKFKYDFDIDGDYIKWEAIRYIVDGFFIKHIDGKEGNNHYGTAIMLPPINYNLITEELTSEPVYTGGELVINDTVIVADKNEWKLIVFTIDTPHELKPVLTGERIIFKTKLKYDYDMMYLIESKTYNKLVDFTGDYLTKEIDDEIKSLKEKIEKLEVKKNTILQDVFAENEFIQTIKNDYKKPNKDYYSKSWNSQFIVLLEDYYNTPIPDNFNKNDKYTFNLLLKNFPSFIIRVINIGGKINYGSRNENYDISFSKQTESNYKEFKDGRDSHYKFEDLPVYHNFEEGTCAGDNENTFSEYNDETYDQIDVCNFTILHVQKNNELD